MVVFDLGRMVFEIIFIGIIIYFIFFMMVLKVESKNKDKINVMWFGKS